MAFAEKTFYVAKCDGCGDEFEGGEFAAWAQLEGAEADAVGSGWDNTDDNRLLCLKCIPADAEEGS